MYLKRTTVINETGIHARPAAEFAQKAKKYPCKIKVTNLTAKGTAVNAKSIVSLIGEEFTKGSIIEISADGEQEQEAVEALADLIDSGVWE